MKNKTNIVKVNEGCGFSRFRYGTSEAARIEAENDAKRRLLAKYPGANNISVFSRVYAYYGDYSDYYWIAYATGEIDPVVEVNVEEGFFHSNKEEAENDAKKRLLAKYPSVTNITISSRYGGCDGYNHEFWYASAEGKLKNGSNDTKKEKKTNNVVIVTWGYGQPGTSGKHINGQTYEYEEGFFTKAEAERDAKLKLQEKYPGVTIVSVLPRHYGCHGKACWFAVAEGKLKNERNNMKKEKKTNRTVMVTWGYGQSGANGKHISGQSYTYDEGYFTKSEAARDAKLKLQQHYPSVTNISVSSLNDNDYDTRDYGGIWYAVAEGEIPQAKKENNTRVKKVIVGEEKFFTSKEDAENDAKNRLLAKHPDASDIAFSSRTNNFDDNLWYASAEGYASAERRVNVSKEKRIVRVGNGKFFMPSVNVSNEDARKEAEDDAKKRLLDAYPNAVNIKTDATHDFAFFYWTATATGEVYEKPNYTVDAKQEDLDNKIEKKIKEPKLVPIDIETNPNWVNSERKAFDKKIERLRKKPLKLDPMDTIVTVDYADHRFWFDTHGSKEKAMEAAKNDAIARLKKKYPNAYDVEAVCRICTYNDELMNACESYAIGYVPDDDALEMVRRKKAIKKLKKLHLPIEVLEHLVTHAETYYSRKIGECTHAEERVAVGYGKKFWHTQYDTPKDSLLAAKEDAKARLLAKYPDAKHIITFERYQAVGALEGKGDYAEAYAVGYIEGDNDE